MNCYEHEKLQIQNVDWILIIFIETLTKCYVFQNILIIFELQ